MKLLKNISKKKILSQLLAAILFLSPLLSLASPAVVQASYEDCSTLGIQIISGQLGDSANFKVGEVDNLALELDISQLEKGTYKAWVYYSDNPFQDLVDGTSSWNSAGESKEFTVDDNATTADINFTGGHTFQPILTENFHGQIYRYIHIFRKRSVGLYTTPSYCYLGFYGLTNAGPTCTEPLKISQTRDADGNTNTPPIQCFANGASCMEANTKISVSTSGLVDSEGKPYEGSVTISDINKGFSTSVKGGTLQFENTLSAGEYSVVLKDFYGTEFQGPCKMPNLTISGRCPASSICANTPPTSGESIADKQVPFKLCSQITNIELRGKCEVCAGGSATGKAGVWTAVGCIKRDPQSIIKRFIQVGIGVGGGICLLMCLAAGFMLTTSQGDLKQATEAKNMLTSAIIGILFIIFSVVILQFIGVTILNIPGFGTA